MTAAQDLPTIIRNGEAKLAAGNYQGAEQDFATAIRLNEGVTNAYLDKMKKYSSMNEFQKSSSDMPDGFVYNHDLAVPYYGHGVALQNLGRQDEALADLEKAIAIDPKYADAFCARGIAQIAKGARWSLVGLLAPNCQIATTSSAWITNSQLRRCPNRRVKTGIGNRSTSGAHRNFSV